MPSASLCLDTIRVWVSKKRPTRSLFQAQDKVRSGLVDDFLDGILGLADGLLSFTLALLQGAFDLKVWVAYGLAGALLDHAGGLVRHALDLVGSAAHDWSPEELMAAHSPALYLTNAQIYVRVAMKMISVEKFLTKIHPEFRGEWNYTITPTLRIAAIISQRRQRISDAMSNSFWPSSYGFSSTFGIVISLRVL